MKYSQYFQSAVRTSTQKEFIKLKEDAPKELETLIREIHFRIFEGCLPNDWIYKTILEAFEELEENKLDEINIEADCYYNDLYTWLGEPFAHGICNEYLEEFAYKTTKIYELIASAQWLAKDKIYNAVNEFMEEHNE